MGGLFSRLKRFLGFGARRCGWLHWGPVVKREVGIVDDGGILLLVDYGGQAPPNPPGLASLEFSAAAMLPTSVKSPEGSKGLTLYRGRR